MFLTLLELVLTYETKYLFGAIISKIIKICRIVKRASQDIHILLYYFFHQYFHCALKQRAIHQLVQWKSIQTAAGKSFAPVRGIKLK